MSLPAIPRLLLSDGNSIPQLGFGTWKIVDEEAAAAARTALDLGYRHLDTASLYANERGVGQGLRESGVARERGGLHHQQSVERSAGARAGDAGVA